MRGGRTAAIESNKRKKINEFIGGPTDRMKLLTPPPPHFFRLL